MLKRNSSNIQSRDIASIVININNNKYEVQIDNVSYWIKNGVGVELNIGDPVWIHVPNGNIKEMFIMAKK